MATANWPDVDASQKRVGMECRVSTHRRTGGFGRLANVDAGETAMPKRIQLSRRKGWRMPANTARVSRPGPWGNPYRVGDADPRTGEPIPDRATVVRLYERHVTPQLRARIRAELKGKNLACWCSLDGPCHADLMLQIANGEDGDGG